MRNGGRWLLLLELTIPKPDNHLGCMRIRFIMQKGGKRLTDVGCKRCLNARKSRQGPSLSHVHVHLGLLFWPSDL